MTGASSGIGRATATLLGRAGALVGVHCHTHVAAAQAVAADIERTGGRACVLDADVTDPAARQNLIPRMLDALGGLDALVNNAGGIPNARSLDDLTEADWDAALELNLTAPFFLSQAAFAHMRENGGGKIVNVTSVGVHYAGSATTMHYSAAKAALELVTRALARSGAPHGILVNAVRPGFIDTPLHQHLSAEARQRRLQMVPLKRAGTPADVGRMILYLLSSGADFVTGQIIGVTGGD
ncbi:MAG: SDR family NAD(P)-dependent oxidoreductase [Vicinamibacterales bacterium]